MLCRGDRFQGYLIVDVLGRGGSATVYRAREAPGAAGGRSVALKVLDAEHRTPAHLARLQREYEFALRLDHPHVVTMYATGPGWLSMALLDGGPVSNLSRLCDRLAALAHTADALDYAHHRGIVHCDVKPANILVGADFAETGGVLIDFGVAHAVSDFIRSEVGTVSRRYVPVQASLSYTAPELFGGHAPAATSDQYALACSTAELVTGSPPFTASTRMELIDHHLNHAPPALSREVDGLPRGFDSILARAMAKLPEARYDSCAEFVSLIRDVLR